MNNNNNHNTDFIKAASQYQSKELNSVCLLLEKKKTSKFGGACLLLEKKKTSKFGGADQWYDGSFNLNIPN